jgi:D-alanyl-lipoteichoic acid acyltransferase DltB (MBOAT superfamily)
VWRAVNVVLTIHVVCFGLLIFSGRLAHQPKTGKEKVEPAASAVATPPPAN